jgi:hypothetical protein
MESRSRGGFDGIPSVTDGEGDWIATHATHMEAGRQTLQALETGVAPLVRVYSVPRSGESCGRAAPGRCWGLGMEMDRVRVKKIVQT